MAKSTGGFSQVEIGQAFPSEIPPSASGQYSAFRVTMKAIGLPRSFCPAMADRQTGWTPKKQVEAVAGKQIGRSTLKLR